MRNFLLSLVFAITAIAVQAQDPAIVMTTTKSINSQFSFGIKAQVANTPIQIDWGNGVKENFSISDVTEFFSYPLKGNYVKIWGTGIASLTASSKELTALDVTRATSLTYLYIKTNLLTTLDLSNCTALTFVECSENLLTSLTLPNTSTLTAVNCDNNLLASLNVSGATGITELTCTNNKLTFATLPVKQPTWTTYSYSPQQNISLPKQTYSTNEEIDLSSQLTAGSNATTYTWKTASGKILVNGTDFNTNGGKFTFLKTYTESLYCEMINATFPSLTLNSVNISIPAIPSVIMTTAMPVGSAFSFRLNAIISNTTIQIDWGNGVLTNYTIGTSSSTVSGTLASNTIKIYGTGISMIDVSANKLNSFDVKNCNSIKEIYCHNNTIKTLDVEGLNALEILHCYSNGMTNLNIKNCPSLSTLHCYYNELTSLNTNGCSSLKLLYCTGNKIAALNVSVNPNLEELGCTDNQLSTLNLTQNAKLKMLGCSNNKLTSIDLSSNPLLYRLHLANNQLSVLNLSNNPLINKLDIPNNWLSFKSLPIKTTTLTDYIYSPQRTVKLTKKQYFPLETLDLSSELTVNGKTTNYIWKTKGGSTLVAGTDYNVNGGVTTFLKGQADSVYCQMTNAAFPDLILRTENVFINTTDPVIIMTTTIQISSSFKFEISANLNNSLIKVDWGNSTLVDYIIGTIPTTISGVLAGNNIKIYGVGISMIDVSANKLNSFDVKNCNSIKEIYCHNNTIKTLDVEGLSALTILHCYSNGMTTLNVKNCPSLSTLHCYYNELNSLNTNGCNSLKLLYCTGNKITSLSVSGNQNLEELGCTDNNLTTLDLTQNTKLKLLGCSNNKLTSIDLSSNALLHRLHLANNQLSSINLSNNPLINRLDIPGNWLTFSLLPIKTSTLTDYIYSPQRCIILAKKQYGLTETVDLSSELTVNANATNYAWKTKDGVTLTAGTDYNVTNGVTTFLKVQSDSVYCQMTNATFPDLTLTTTNIKVSQFPLSVGENEVAVKVYPNPATQYFSVEMAEEIVRVEVYTLTGVKVFENGMYNSTKVTIPLGNMPIGALLVRTFTRNGVYESKVLKM